MANSGNANVGVLFGDGKGVFASQHTYTAGTKSPVAMADVDGEKRLDVLAANCDSYDLSVLLNAGGGTLLPKVTFVTGKEPRSVAAVNLDVIPILVAREG